MTVRPGNAPMITPASVPTKIISRALKLKTTEAAARMSFMMSVLPRYSKKTETGSVVLKTCVKKK